MPTAWLQHRSALVLSLFLPWLPAPLSSPPEAQPPTVTAASVSGEPQTATPAPEKPQVLPGVVIEEIPKGSVLEKAGLQVGDVILSWERLPNPPENPEGASGKITSPFDWMWLAIEQPPRGTVVLSYLRDNQMAFANLTSEGYWGAAVTPSLSESTGRRFAALKSSLNDAKGVFAFARVKEEIDLFRKSLPPVIISSQFLALGNIYARFSRSEDATSAYQAALAELDNGIFQAMVISSQASLYHGHNRIGEEIALFNRAGERYRAAGAYVLLARERQKLARLYVTSNDYPQASEVLDEAVEVLTLHCPRSLALASVLNSRGVLRRDLRDLSGSRSDHEAALKISRDRDPCGVQEASALSGLGNIFYILGDLREAENTYREIIANREQKAPEGSFMANALANLANVYQQQGNIKQSLPLNEHALRIRMVLAPESSTVADSLNSIGLDYKDIGDLSAAESFLQEALRIRSSLAPGSLEEAEVVSNLGLVALEREEYDEAIYLFLRARTSLQTLQQGQPFLAGVSANMGNAYYGRGDLLTAEKFFTEAAEGLKGSSGSDPEIATVMLNLGNVSYERADYDLASERYREARKLFRGSGKSSRELSVCLSNLAAVAQRMHRLAEATALYRESLSIEEELAPHGSDLARILANMGLISLDEGKFSEAESLETRALSIAGKLGQPLGVAQVLTNLGEIAMERHSYAKALAHYHASLRVLENSNGGLRERAEDLFNIGCLYQEMRQYDRAQRLLLRALETSRGFVQGTWLEAEIQYALGELAERRGQAGVSRQLFSSAVSIIENQATRFEPLPSDRQPFRVKYRTFYDSLLKNLASAGDVREGFAVAERGKGRALLETLRMRDLETEYSTSRSSTGHDLRAIEARMMQTAQTLSAWTGDKLGAEERERTVERLLRLRQEYDDALSDLKQNSPEAAALWDPKFLDAEAASASLEPRIIFLSYWVSPDRIFLFLLSREGSLRVHELPIDRHVLSERIRRFRELMNSTQSNSTVAELRNQEIRRLGKELYQLLVFPVEDQIETSDRVQIAPDGPLNYLPFGALVRTASEGNGLKRDQYFAEWKPLHSVLSATVYAEEKKDRRPAERGTLKLVAFGDPQFPTEMNDREPDFVSDLHVRSAMRRGAASFASLPFSRHEVEGIASVFPPGEAQIFVGADATEERAKAVGKTARILHFATHARLDDRLPLDSALVLTMPEGFPPNRDNGLLQVWEIFENMRLDADLVVLSGCETALGEEQDGEGLIGLTRAFQYAGARTVMASLWSVQDQATSELMIRFYKHLHAGLTKDEALRQAQIELIRSPIEVVNEKGEKTLLDASAPYFWAGFQLYGDWQ